MKRIFISSVQKEFERERAAIEFKRPLLEEVPSGFRIVIWRPKAVANRGAMRRKVP